jgi:glycosyltransferase involved in cell wall biosynthesis
MHAAAVSYPEPDDRPLPTVLMVGAAVTPEVMDLLTRIDPAPQVQTYRLHWAFIRAIEAAGRTPIDVVSTVPTKDYPLCRKLFWGLHREQRQIAGKMGNLVMMPFVNCLGLKQITRFLSCLWCTLSWLWQRRGQDKVIILYGLIVSHLYVALPLGKLFSAKVLAIVTDAPTPRQPEEGSIYALARVLDRWLLLRSLRGLDGIVVLAAGAAKLLAPDVPALVIEGIISDEVAEYAQKPAPAPAGAPFAFMYAGQLEPPYGIDLLLDAFTQLEGPQWALWVFGRGRLAPEVERAAAADPRITYFGFQPNDILFGRMRQASVLVNPRPLDQVLTPFMFPSKVLEYMAMGKIVVSSRLPGIPEEYYRYMIPVDELSPATLAAVLREVASWDPARRRRFEEEVRAFVWLTKTQLPQGRRFCTFIKDLVAGDTGTYRQ